MLVSQNWEKIGSESQPHLSIVLSFPLPPQQAERILQNLRTNCNSHNKTTQLVALRYWDTWITNHDLKEWEADSICHFALKPLMTRKLHPLYWDVDICKLKLNIMWKLLANVQTIIELSGPQHILECFLQSCFIWLTSLESLDKNVSVLILQLLLNLLKGDNKEIRHENYIFSPLNINIFVIKNLINSFLDKFLGVFNNWNKINENGLLVDLWKWFLEHCEKYHEFVTTQIWHGIFKVNNYLCSEQSKSLNEKLIVLNICASYIKTVLLSSKYIGGGNCFTTPCEVLLKKLVEICSSENNEDSADSEIFTMCENISTILSQKSILVCDFKLCIYLLDVLDDIFVKSCAWGIWCGLVKCFKSTLQSVQRINYTKIQTKFYRKLRAATVNYELDKCSLNEHCRAKVIENIVVLNLDCICKEKYDDCTKEQISGNVVLRDSDKYSDTEGDDCNSALVPLNSEFQSYDSLKKSFAFSSSNHFKGCWTLKFTSEKLKSVCSDRKGLESPLRLPYCSVDFVKGFFNTLSKNIPILQFSFININNYSCALSNSFNNFTTSKTLKIMAATSTETHKKSRVAFTSKKESKNNSFMLNVHSRKTRNSLVGEQKSSLLTSAMEEINTTPRTRSQRRAEEEAKRKTEDKSPRKKRKRFEDLVQEIVNKNKLRKTEKNIKAKTVVTSIKRELRNKKKTVENNKVKITKRSENKNVKNERLRNILGNRIEEFNGAKKTSVGKLESFFPVISQTEERLAIRQTRKERDSKCSDLKKKKTCAINKNKGKGEINWKQTSLKSMIAVKSGKTVQKTTREKGNKVLEKSKIELKNVELYKTSPFKEVLHDHEYASIIEPCKVLLQKSKFAKCFKKYGKKPKTKPAQPMKEKCTFERSVETNHDTSGDFSPKMKEEELVTKKTITVENSLSNPSEAQENTMTDANLRENEFCSGKETDISSVLLLEEEQNNSTVDNVKNFENCAEELISSLARDLNTRKDSTIDMPKTNREELADNLSNEEYCSSFCTVEKEKKVAEVEEKTRWRNLSRGEKRDRTNSPSPAREKKIKLDEECIANGDETVEKENLKIDSERVASEFSSPVKSVFENSISVSSPKTKEESPSHTPSRRLSSRALKMLALVPESLLRGQQHMTPESVPKTEPKPQGKRFPMVNQSSRVSKMLASLTKNMPQDMKSLDEKLMSDSPGSGFSNGTCPSEQMNVAKNGKRRKFISFDDSKNKTIIFQTDTPPSQILLERGKLTNLEDNSAKFNQCIFL